MPGFWAVLYIYCRRCFLFESKSGILTWRQSHSQSLVTQRHQQLENFYYHKQNSVVHHIKWGPTDQEVVPYQSYRRQLQVTIWPWLYWSKWFGTELQQRAYIYIYYALWLWFVFGLERFILMIYWKVFVEVINHILFN